MYDGSTIIVSVATPDTLSVTSHLRRLSLAYQYVANLTQLLLPCGLAETS
jgi:hypothetical protein